MSEVKQKALDKMNEELSKPHSSTEDYIHNWLCDQEDDELFECILKEGKTINDSLSYLTRKAKEGSHGSTAAVMSDAEGFKIIVDYFKGKETSVQSYGVVSNKPIKVEEVQESEEKTTTPKVKPIEKVKAKKEVKDENPLMSMFDFGVEDVEQQEVEDVDEEEGDDEE